MSTTILQNDGLQSLNWQQITQDQIVTRVASELEKGTEKIQEKFDSQNLLLSARSEQLATIKASVNNAEIAVDNGEEGVEEIEDFLMEMRILLGNYPESESKDKLREDFDEYVDKINRTADMYAKAYNPIGKVVGTDWSPNTISYTKDLASNRSELMGTYIGSDFYIEADDGTMWVNDPGASNLQQYEIYNTENEPSSTKAEGLTSTRTGLKLNSYNEQTGEVSVTVDPENDSTIITGTLHIGGTGLMQNWFYDIDTEEGREKALAAIEKAEALVAGAKATLTGMKSTITRDMAKIDRDIAEVSEERGEAMEQQMIETYELQIKKQQEVQILQNTFNAMAEQQANYSNIFQSVSKNPLLDVLI